MWYVFVFLAIPLFTSSIWMMMLCIWLIVHPLIRKKPKVLERYPEVAIMVPHFNEKPEYLIQALNSIEAQDYPGQITVILADDGSTNGIQSHLTEWFKSPKKQNYKSIRFEQNNGSKGKNMDAALPNVPESVEALVVVDSDTFLEPQSVRKVVERMWQDEKCAAVCGFLVPANKQTNVWEKLQYFEHIGIYPAVKSAQDAFGFVSIMAGAFVVHRMSVIREIGGWGSWIVEDIAWTWKALASGYTTGYSPEAVAYTYAPTNSKCLFKQRRRWARGRVEAYRAAISTSPRRALFLIPFFMLYILSLLPPTLCALPVLAVVFQQWWVFGLIGVSTFLSISMFLLYQKQLPEQLRKGARDIFRSTYYNSLFELFLWRPNVIGFCDEIFGKAKSWMTRG